MKTSIHHVGYGQIEYEENLFTGKKSVSVNGVKLKKQKKNRFDFDYYGIQTPCQVKGGFVSGARLYIGEDILELSKPSKWYEVALSVFICVFVLLWGNLPALYNLFPMIGGAFGGAIAGFGMFMSLIWMRSIKKVILKILAWLLVFVATVFTCFAFAGMLLLMFSSAVA